MADASEVSQRVQGVVGTLGALAETVLRSPGSTIEPPRQLRDGGRALEVLRRLHHDPGAFVDEGLLGRGGMGVVKLARQVALDRLVAVKTLKAPASDDDVRRLLAEAWLTGALEHPGILPIYALTLDAEGCPQLVMKRIEGLTWAGLLAGEGALPDFAPGRAGLEAHLRVMLQLCNAVHFAHARGVIHRDLKPHNVMLGSFGEVYLMDWGLATAAGPCAEFAGTPAYMAPEMLGGDRAVLSPQTDVYLLGAVLFELLTGQPPHLRGSTREMIESVVRSSPVLPAETPPELSALVCHCMAAAPSERPASAMEVRRALEDFLEHQGSRELQRQSELRAAELEQLLSSTSPELARVTRLFSECRFGLQQAVRAWPGNDPARARLAHVTERLIDFELSRGSARAAESLLHELEEPPPALRARVTAALEQEALHAREVERLKAIAASVDPLAGLRRRISVAFSLGTLWVLGPLLGGLVVPRFPELETVATVPVTLFSVFFVVAIILKIPAAEQTPLNRQIAHLLVFGMSVQALGLPFVRFGLGLELGRFAVPAMLAYWSLMCGAIAAALVRPVWPAAVGFLACGWLAFERPEWRFVVGALGNVLLLVNLAVLFRAQLRALAARERGPGSG